MKIITKLLFAILAVLGFSSCQGGGVEMYGTPTANFKLNATVSDKETGAAVQGIKLDLSDVRTLDAPVSYYTDQNGLAKVDIRLFQMDQTIKVVFEDVDGEENGVYKKDSVEIKINSADYKGGDGSWYYGEQTKEITIEIEKEKL